jgi:hypothetical protein
LPQQRQPQRHIQGIRHVSSCCCRQVHIATTAAVPSTPAACRSQAWNLARPGEPSLHSCCSCTCTLAACRHGGVADMEMHTSCKYTAQHEPVRTNEAATRRWAALHISCMCFAMLSPGVATCPTGSDFAVVRVV